MIAQTKWNVTFFSLEMNDTDLKEMPRLKSIDLFIDVLSHSHHYHRCKFPIYEKYVYLSFTEVLRSYGS